MKAITSRWTSQAHAVLLLFAMSLLAGCQGLNPFAAADTLEQRAFAVEASYNIALQSAVDLVNDPAVPSSAKSRILTIEEQSTVVVESLAAATDEYIAAKALFEADRTSEERVTIVANNLERWIASAESAIARLSGVVRQIGD